MSKERILIIGGGYAGMMAAIRLAGKTRRLPVEITLVNAVDVFVPRLRLHEYATDQPVPFTPIAQLLRGTGVNFVQGRVTALQPASQSVMIQSEGGDQSLPYDYLVYALGSSVDQSTVPGVSEHAYVFNLAGPLAAPALKEKLDTLRNAKARVVVIGGGATGIEGATQLRGFYPNFQVQLITEGEFGAFKGSRVQRHFRQAFDQQGIPIHEHTPVQAVAADAVVTIDGVRIPFDVCLWAGGFRALPMAREAGLRVNEKDQILVDPLLRSVSHPTIYAVGDAAMTTEYHGAPNRMSVFTALVTGAHGADNLNALLRGRQQKPLSFAYYGQGIALGPDDAVGFMTYPADEAAGPIFRGRTAVSIRNFFVWFLTFSLQIERRVPGFFLWLGKGRYAAAKRRAQQQSASQQSA